jgi:ferredoxin--NADP+ reductase
MSNELKTHPEIIFPDVAVNMYKPNNPVEVPVLENRLATLEVSPNIIRHIVVDVKGTGLEGNIRSGQSIGAIPEGYTERDGKPAKVRLYSIASPTKGEDGNPNLVAITVKRVIEEDHSTNNLFLGICSNYLSSLSPGDRLKITGPSGKRFVLPENAHDFNYVFFATGTGVAPYRGMVTDLLDSGFSNQVALIFGCPYRTDLLYYDFFRELSVRHDNFHYLTSISREGARPDGTKNYVQYQLLDSREVLQPIVSQKNTLIYVCGLKGMELGLFQIMASEGFSDYLRIDEEIRDKPPAEWVVEDLKKRVRPSERMFLEVY